MSSSRQLAAIMFTDIQGYTAIMQQDEEQAIKIRERHRDIFDSTTKKYRGKILQYYGDGTLSIFNSAIDAVKCGIEMQLAYQLDPKIPVRVGIHTGDIIFSEEEIIGDGVNVASRIESLAVAGSVFISDKVYDEIKNQNSIQTQTIGTFELKNVERPVNVLAISNEGLVVPEARETNQMTGTFWAEVKRRGLIRSGVAYLVVVLLLILLLREANSWLTLPDWSMQILIAVLAVGFALAMYLAWNYERSPEGFVNTTSQQSWQNPYSAARRKPMTGTFIIAGLALVIVIMYLYPRFLSVDQNQGSTDSSLDLPVMDKSIAVLPFENMSNDPEQSYFSNGMTVDILTQLSKIGDLRVISRASIMQYINTTKSTIEIAEELGVTYILAGSVRKYDDNVRISVQLIEARTDSHIWADDFDRELKDIFAIQRDVSLEVASVLKATLTSAEKKRFENIPTENTEAYEKYQKGQELIRRGGTMEEFDKALILFQEAIELDPNFSLAYVGLADVYLSFADWGLASPNETIPKAMEAALKAQGIDSEIAECNETLGGIYISLIDFETSEKYLKKAMELSPNYVLTYTWLAVVEMLNGNLDQSIEFYKKARDLDPLAYGYSYISWVYYNFRQYDKAEEVLKNFLVAHPDDNFALWNLANTYTAQGKYQKAIDTFHKRTAGTNTNWALGLAYGLLGNKEEALRILNYLLEKKKKQYVPSFMISVVYVGLGEKEKALDWLERGYNTEGANSIFLVNMKMGSHFDPLRDEPRFIDLLNRLGLESNDN